MAKKKEKQKQKKQTSAETKKVGAPYGNKNAVGNHGGRTTTYDPRYCDMLLDYFFSANPTVEVRKTYNNNGSVKSEEEYIVAPELPTLQYFATKIVGCSYKCLNEWSKKYVEFGEVYACAKDYQDHLILSNGMANRYNPSLAKLWIENRLGLSEKVDVQQDINASPQTIEAFLNAGSGADM